MVDRDVPPFTVVGSALRRCRLPFQLRLVETEAELV